MLIIVTSTVIFEWLLLVNMQKQIMLDIAKEKLQEAAFLKDELIALLTILSVNYTEKFWPWTVIIYSF